MAAQGEIDLIWEWPLFDRPFIFTPHVSYRAAAVDRGRSRVRWLAEGCYRMPRSEVFGRDGLRWQRGAGLARDIDMRSPIAVHGPWDVDRALVELIQPWTQACSHTIGSDLPGGWIKH